MTNTKTKPTKKKPPLLVPDKENILTGKQLQAMGRHLDSNGFLIAATLKYTVFLLPGNWEIRKLKNK